MIKWQLINIFFSSRFVNRFKTQDTDLKKENVHHQLFPDPLSHHTGNPVPQPLHTKLLVQGHPPLSSSFPFRCEDSRTEVRGPDSISTGTRGNFEVATRGRMIDRPEKADRMLEISRERNDFRKNMNLDGKNSH